MKYQQKRSVSIILLAVAVAISAVTGSSIQPAVPEQTVNSFWKYGGIAITNALAYADTVDLENGQYRMYYNADPEAAGFEGQVYSALSEDGVNWRQEEGIRMTGAVFPEVLKLADGSYRMYFQNQNVIKSAISADGLSWDEEAGIRMGTTNTAGLTLENLASPTVLKVHDTLYIMVYHGIINERYSPTAPNTNISLLLGAISADGFTFEQRGVILDSRNEEFQGMLAGPEFVVWEDGSNRLYFGSYGGIYHITYADLSFSQAAVFDYSTDTSTSFPENPPADPTFMTIAARQFLYYNQPTKGIYFATDKPWKVCNDFNGDGRTDPAVYYPASGKWEIFQTTTFTLRTEYLGSGSCLPAPGDYDGDGKTDIVVFDSTTANWSYRFSSGAEGTDNFGWPGTWPVAADFDGDRKTDAAVYDPQTGIWSAFLSQTHEIVSAQWGHLGDFRSWENPQTYTVLPMPFDYNQDGVDDLAVYYRGLSMADSTWTILYVGESAAYYTWGSSGSLPVPGYYNYCNEELGMGWARGICIYKLVNKNEPAKSAEWDIPYRNAFYMGTYPQTLPVPAGDYDGNGYNDNAVYNYETGLWTVVLNTDTIEVTGRPQAALQLGGPGAVPANIYSTIYALALYSPEPW